MRHFLLLLTSFTFYLSGNATLFSVSNNNDSGIGSLRQSIENADNNPGSDTIVFSALINGNDIILTSGTILIDGNLTILGNGVINTTLNGEAIQLTIGPNIEVTISDISFVNFSSAGISRPFSPSSTSILNVLNCSFTGNGSGAGIQYSVIDGSILVDGCTFSTLQNGVQIESCTNAILTNNYATNCTGGTAGLAIYNTYNSGNTHVTNNTVKNCNNGFVIGVGFTGVISNNTSYLNNQGGLIINLPFGPASSVVITNNTIANNQVGIEIMEDISSSAANLTIQNSILWNNSFTDIYISSMMMNGGNPNVSNNIGLNSNSPYGPLSFLSSSDPLLSSLGTENNGGLTPTIMISSGSSAINAGTPSNSPVFDQRGFLRNGTIDVGAIEFNGIDCSTPSVGFDTVNACYAFTWIDGNTYLSSTSSPTFTVQGGASNGCDSIVTLHLTINTLPDVSTAVNSAIISANNQNASYVWLYCDNSFDIVPGETAQTFTPSINGSYAVEITENGCTDTSDCALITSVKLIENQLFKNLIVSPNPTTDWLTIDFLEMIDFLELSLFSSDGKLIQSSYEQNCKKLNYRFPDSKGVYILKLTDNQLNTHSVRIVKD